jgi:hypothetical protein
LTTVGKDEREKGHEKGNERDYLGNLRFQYAIFEGQQEHARILRMVQINFAKKISLEMYHCERSV